MFISCSTSPRHRKFLIVVIGVTVMVCYLFYVQSTWGTAPRERGTPPALFTHPRIVVTRPANPSSSTCSPVQDFVFVKTHKTGSSTMSNILLRFTELHGLNQLFAEYPAGTEYKSLERKVYPPAPAPSHRYNAFIMHAGYNPAFLLTKLPGHTRFFTMMRHPVSRYISAFWFYKQYKNYVTAPSDFEKAIQRHLSDNGQYLTSTTSCLSCSHSVNSIAVDLGFNFWQYMNAANRTEFMSNFLRERDKELDLVLISEYYDLSLVLLMRRYCWSFEDIIYLKSLESTTKPTISDATKKDILEFQRVDADIYNHYNKTFWKLVGEEEGIHNDVVKFKEYNRQALKKCIKGKTEGRLNTWKYELTSEGLRDFNCLAMNTRVLPFARLLEIRNQNLDIDIPQEKGTLGLDDVNKIREQVLGS